MEQMQPDLSHHNRLEYCTNRLNYRDGRKLTAVKVRFKCDFSSTFECSLILLINLSCSLFQVYTIVNESKYLLVFGVPRINLLQEVKQLFAKYGRISGIQKITDKVTNNKTSM